MPDPALVFDYLCARCGIDPRDERGMTTTEVAVITFLLVGAAIVVLGIIYTALDLQPDAPGSNHCGSCTRCMGVFHEAAAGACQRVRVGTASEPCVPARKIQSCELSRA